MKYTPQPDTFTLANALTYGEAIALVGAIDAALEAMSNYGSVDEHMMTLSALRIVAMKERDSAFRNEKGQTS